MVDGGTDPQGPLGVEFPALRDLQPVIGVGVMTTGWPATGRCPS
jgi:hypothetical protein